ncbi:hypothetical protein Poli38472_003998 [Pythium oligandrum]|uniref:Uncharacterized protein n=1 Tax=Pythium oligandrum TaxID=41045 RepID=A0A8K1CPX5_PYTOL|nr:hypothetical protein Poli38472_003998 [Pythium oligandrum]|eukprot:TMW66233.1 hypothetical protein Poli38472_003998 [Pythium oligandrum]
MDSPNTPCSMTSNSHQAMMKCPWQWRQPFLDEKLASRKRKVGDGFFYDPVDPNFVDHLLPGHAKKFCADVLESEEKEKIQREIERLMLKKEEEQDELASQETMLYDSLLFTHGKDALQTSESDANDSDADVSSENMALVDSILLMSKAVEEASQASSLLASPQSVSSSSDDDDLDSGLYSGDESTTRGQSFDLDHSEASEYEPPSPLELVSDNLQETFFAPDDDDLLDFATTSEALEATHKTGDRA